MYCRYEQRNVGIIKFVVMLVMTVIGLLVLYLLVVVLEPVVMQRCQRLYTYTNNSRPSAEQVPSIEIIDNPEKVPVVYLSADVQAMEHLVTMVAPQFTKLWKYKIKCLFFSSEFKYSTGYRFCNKNEIELFHS
jgi:TMEM9